MIFTRIPQLGSFDNKPDLNVNMDDSIIISDRAISYNKSSTQNFSDRKSLRLSRKTITIILFFVLVIQFINYDYTKYDIIFLKLKRGIITCIYNIFLLFTAKNILLILLMLLCYPKNKEKEDMTSSNMYSLGNLTFENFNCDLYAPIDIHSKQNVSLKIRKTV